LNDLSDLNDLNDLRSRLRPRARATRPHAFHWG
jgi:hypothetical protein